MTLAYQLFSLPDSSDWITFTLGIIITILITSYIYSIRPKLEISVPKISDVDNYSIVVPIKNLQRTRKLVRIKTGVAVVLNNLTYTFKVLEDDFAFLDPLGTRKFKAYDVNDYLRSLPNENCNNFSSVFNMLFHENAILRVKVHASDSFSGMGRTEVSHFKYVAKENGGFHFIKINL